MVKILFLVALISTIAKAEDGCTNPKTNYDKTYCIAKLFVESDTELNVVYDELKTALTPNASKVLLTAQRKWLKFRDNNCSDKDGIMVDCNYHVNKYRTEKLRDRLRECKTGHCQDNLLSVEDWNFQKK
jgi:uncharacterized protein YecT (DUF1311 family)